MRISSSSRTCRCSGAISTSIRRRKRLDAAFQNEWIKPLVKPVKEGGRRDITGSACWISPRTMCRRLMKEKAMTKQCGPAIPGYPREPAPARLAGQRPIPRSTPPIEAGGILNWVAENGHPGWRTPIPPSWPAGFPVPLTGDSGGTHFDDGKLGGDLEPFNRTRSGPDKVERGYKGLRPPRQADPGESRYTGGGRGSVNWKVIECLWVWARVQTGF